jgi:hypothetical protein
VAVLPGWPRQASNLQPPAQEAGALPVELRSQGRPSRRGRQSVTGRSRTCDASRFRRVLRLDDPGTRGRPLHPRPLRGRRCSGGPILGGRSRPLSRPPRKPNDVVQATRLPFDPGSSTAGCAVRCDRRPTWRGFGARVSRTSPKIRRRKQTLNTDAHFVLSAEESFSLRRGLDSV